MCIRHSHQDEHQVVDDRREHRRGEHQAGERLRGVVPRPPKHARDDAQRDGGVLDEQQMCIRDRGWGGQMASRLCYWFNEIGVLSVFVAPDCNYAAAVHADKWIPVLPNTDVALQLAIAYVWMTEGTYEKEYIDTHSVGFDWFEYCLLYTSRCV